MYEQRVEKTPDQFEARGAWRPAGTDMTGDLRDLRSAVPWYVVVDEVHGGWCRLTVDVWPEVDADGRLVFDIDRTSAHWVLADRLHAVISQARAAAAAGPEDAAAADRPLRIGDVFALWPRAADLLDLDPPLRAPDAAEVGAGPPNEPSEGLVDITAAARAITHAAVDAVAAGDLTVEDLRQLGIPLSAVQGEADEAGPQR